MFGLLGHEFFHKTKFQNEVCLEDAGTFGPFEGMEGGRKLIDAMSEALGKFAISQGIIGGEFGVTDYFTCRVNQLDGPIKFSYPVPTQRIFFDTISAFSPAFSSYHSGTEKFPKDGECSFAVGKSDLERLNLKLSVLEKNNCEKYAEPDSTLSRGVVLQLIKSTKRLNQPDKIEILDAKNYPGINPLCDKEKSYLNFSTIFESEENLKFEVSIGYDFSVGISRPKQSFVGR